MALKLKRPPPPRLDFFSVRATPAERRLAEAAAEAAGVTLSELIRAGVRAAASEVLGVGRDGEPGDHEGDLREGGGRDP